MGTRMMSAHLLPLYAILVSALACPLIFLFRTKPFLREAVTITAAILKLTAVILIYRALQEGIIFEIDILRIAPGLTLGLRADSMGVLFALVASSLWLVTSIYSIGYMRGLNSPHQTRFYASFAMSVSATIGIAFSRDLFTFFCFYELLTLATYPLVVHKETKEAILAGRKYLTYSLTAGAVFLCGIIWTYHACGSLTFQAGGFMSPEVSVPLARTLLTLLLCGAFVKAALFPLHAWLPAAMVAPTPVSALLHAVAVVKAGIFCLFRIVGFVGGPTMMQETGLGLVLSVLAGFTILFASAQAMTQTHLKRRLAYSTISQLAYIILGISILSPTAFTGALFHLSAHALLKITLFFCAGAIYVRLHKEYISDLTGWGYKMPFTFFAFLAATLGLSGIPLWNGFISKWFFCLGSLEVSNYAAFSIYILASLLNVVYLLPVLIEGFKVPEKESSREREGSFPLIFPLVLTACLSIAFGTIPQFIDFFLNLDRMITSSVFGILS